MNNYLRRYEESLQNGQDLPQEMIDHLAEACTHIGPIWEELAEAVRALSSRLTEWAPEIAKWAGRYLYPRLMDPEAVKWALDHHPEWVKIYRRTKSGRIRKKYRDRIMREYINR